MTTLIIGNTLYMLIIGLIIVFVFAMVYLSRTVSQRTVFWIITIMLFANFALHFLKQFLPSYLADFPYSLRKSTVENICAVSVVVFPFLFLYGGKYSKDYMYYLGVISGALACLLPSDAMGRELDNFDAIAELTRYYLCHVPLVVAPLMMVASGMHKLDYHRIWKQPFILYFVLSVIFFNELALKLCGLVPCTWEEFFSRGFRNAAFVFGPPPFVDYVFGSLYRVFIPPFFMFEIDSNLYFIPILWLVIPYYIFGSAVYLLISLPFESRHIKIDFLSFKRIRQLRKESSNYE